MRYRFILFIMIVSFFSTLSTGMSEESASITDESPDENTPKGVTLYTSVEDIKYLDIHSKEEEEYILMLIQIAQLNDVGFFEYATSPTAYPVHSSSFYIKKLEGYLKSSGITFQKKDYIADNLEYPDEQSKENAENEYILMLIRISELNNIHYPHISILSSISSTEYIKQLEQNLELEGVVFQRMLLDQ